MDTGILPRRREVELLERRGGDLVLDEKDEVGDVVPEDRDLELLPSFDQQRRRAVDPPVRVGAISATVRILEVLVVLAAELVDRPPSRLLGRVGLELPTCAGIAVDLERVDVR